MKCLDGLDIETLGREDLSSFEEPDDDYELGEEDETL